MFTQIIDHSCISNLIQTNSPLSIFCGDLKPVSFTIIQRLIICKGRAHDSGYAVNIENRRLSLILNQHTFV